MGVHEGAGGMGGHAGRDMVGEQYYEEGSIFSFFIYYLPLPPPLPPLSPFPLLLLAMQARRWAWGHVSEV